MGEWKQIRLLIGLQLRSRLGLSVLKAARRHDSRAFTKQLLLGLCVLIGVASLLFTYGMLLFFIMGPAIEAGLGHAVLGLVFLVCMVMVLVLGLITMVTVVWGAKDIELYAALPLTQRSVFFSKLAVVYISEALITLFIALPAVILYGVNTATGAGFWLLSIPVMLLLPAIPMAVSALLSMLMMRLVARGRRRELWMVVGSFALVALVFALQMGMNRFFAMGADDEEAILRLLADNAGLLRSVTAMFPPAAWAAGALVLGGAEALWQGALYAVVSAAVFCIPALLGGRMFYRGALAQLEAAPKATKGYASGSVRASSVIWSLYKREWKVLLRTGVYALNALTIVVIFPLMLLIMPLMGGSDAGTSELLGLIEQVKGPSLLLILAGVMSLVSLVNPAATTALSREGRQLWLCRSIPVPMTAQVKAKLLNALSIAALGVGLMFLTTVFFLGVPPDTAGLAALVALCAAYPATALSMIPDVIRPKTGWHSEAEAMKQNMNSMIGMVIALAVLLALGFAGWGLSLILEDAYLLAPALSAVCLVSGFAGARILGGVASARLENRDC